MYKVIRYDEFVNEEFNLGSIKKFLIGTGIVATVCLMVKDMLYMEIKFID